MENLKKNNLIYYQQRPHHKQQLRQMIKQQTIDMLEINPNPSDLTRKVYQSLYQDQLERQVAARNSFKEYSNREPTQLETQNIGINNRNKSVSTIIFKDFHREKDKIVQKHINLNYDGGSSFFKASELHEKMREKQQQQMKVTLNSQLNSKVRQQNNKRYIEEIEKQRLQGNITKLKLSAQMEIQAKRKQKQNNRNIYMKQIEQERKRKEQSTNWRDGWNRIGRHNPITNPIQYHIENPYILKQIQENKQIKENFKHHKG